MQNTQDPSDCRVTFDTTYLHNKHSTPHHQNQLSETSATVTCTIKMLLFVLETRVLRDLSTKFKTAGGNSRIPQVHVTRSKIFTL